MVRTVRALAYLCALLFLSSTSAVAQTVTLAWDPSPSSGIAGYYVYVGTQSRHYTWAVDAGNTTTYTVGGLNVGTTYCFSVQAYNTAHQQSAFSGEVCTVPDVALSVASFTSNTDLPASAGVPLAWTAITRGGDGSALEYQFYRQNISTGQWTVVQPYGPSNTYAWTPSAAEAGQYRLQVWVRRAGSATLATWAGTDTFWITDFTLTGLSPNVALPVWPGVAITWTARVVGSTPVEYRFWRYNANTGRWTMVRDYSTQNTYTWTPTANDVGRYWMQVWVRPSGSTAAFQAWRNDDAFQITAASAGLNVSAGWNAPPPIDPGQSITWRAILGGASGSYEYAFYRYNVTSGAWSLLRNWSTTSTATWTPTSSDRGQQRVQVWVRPVGSSSVTGWRNTPDHMVSAIKSTWLTSSVPLPVRAGTLVTWNAGTVGNATSVEYRFWLYNVAANRWTILRDWNSASYCNWVPSAPGNYVVQVWSRTTGSPASFEGWQGTSVFTVLP
jgi:hypothetical protein